MPTLDSAPPSAVRARPRRRRSVVRSRLGRAAALLTSTLVVATSAVLAVPTVASAAPFDGIDPVVYIAQDNPTQLSAANQNAAGFTFTNVGGPYAAGQYNAIGYNTADNYLYGIRRADNHLVRIESNGAVTDRGDLPRLGNGFVNVGSFIAPNRLAVAQSDGNTLWIIDVTTNSVVETRTLSGQAGVSDLTFAQGFLWGIDQTLPESQRRVLVRINPDNGVRRTFALPVALPVALPAGAYGAAWTYGNGNIGFSHNSTGTISQFEILDAAAGTTRLVSRVPGPANGLNDGAAAPGQPVDLAIVKDGPALFDGNGQITYTMTVSNQSQRTSSGFTVSDVLPAGLSNPRVTGATFTYDASTRALSLSSGRLAGGSSTTITVTADAAVAEGTCLTNTAEVTGNEEDPNPANDIDDHEACARTTALTITKVSDADENSSVGDVVTHTVSVTNTGDTAYTTDNPASFTDDLADVLDDATYNNDATAVRSNGNPITPPTLNGTTLSWSGQLGVGVTATFTYSVTLTNAGDGQVLNTACVPAGEATTGTEPCASTTTELSKLTIAKSADRTELPANGGTVNYTITVTNQGPGDTTVDNPATFSDDLSEVLDDGTINEASIVSSTGAATSTGSTLNWTGALAAGQSATVTYAVTYDDSTGDQQLLNVVCLPADLAQNPDDLCRQVQVPGSGLSQSKSVSPESGSTVVPGQDVTYTLTFSNTGQAPAAVDTNDDLSNVLDDATVTVAPAAGEGDLVAGPIGADGTFSITGSVPVGATYTIVYTVQVLPFAEQGNHLLGNVLADPTGSCTPDGCTTENPVPHLTLEKDVTTGTVDLGEVVTYSVTVTNDGEVDYTDANPASFSDDLPGVLDDASYNDDVDATTGDAIVDGSTLSWSGPLAVGESVTVTYSVTITGGGDNVLSNVACTPTNGADAAECGETTTNVPFVVAAKTSDPATGAAVEAGQVITYTLSWTNQGTAAGVVDSLDNLSEVLDDADVTAEPTADSAEVTATRDGAELSVTGPIQAGATVTVTYQVTVRADGDRGDNVLTNQLVPDNPTITPPPVEHPIGELTDSKAVDPASGTTVQPGQVLTYTLTFTNTGEADVTVDREDVLTNVLDDADITSAPAASNAALTVSAVTDGRFTIDGVLTPDQTVTVTYQATVRADGARGDDQLGNFLVDSGSEPPAECVPVEGETPDCTVNPVSNVTVVKSSDPASGTNVQPGQNVTYTLTFTNVSTNPGAADADVDFTDHMENVLDDATLAGAPKSSTPSITATVTGDRIRVVGDLASGETASVTYTVTVKPYSEQGDAVLGNVVSQTGVPPICVEDSPLCTEHRVPPVTPPTTGVPGLPPTGARFAGWTLLASLVLAGVGGGLVVASKRRRNTPISE